MDAGGSTWWILVDSDSTSRMIQGVDHGGSQMWILVDQCGETLRIVDVPVQIEYKGSIWIK